MYLDQTVNGFATLARLGQEIPQTYILSITDANGNNIYQWKQPKPSQVIHRDTAYIIDSILSDPRATYLPGSCNNYTCTPLSSFGYKWQRYNGWDIAVKTGTTHDNISGLMAGWSTQYAVVSWSAYHTVSKPLTAGAMEYMTEPMSRGWLEGALSMLHQKPVNWVQPSNIKVLPAFVQRAHVGVGSEEPGPTKDVFPSWYVGKGSTNTTEVIDKVSGGIATQCTPADAKETVGGANASSFSADQFYPPNQTGTANTTSSVTYYDNVHNCSDAMPTVTLTVPQTCSNTDNNNQGCAITVTATQGTHPLGGGSFGGTISLTIDGAVAKVFNINNTPPNTPATVTYYYQPTASGTVTVSATVTDSVLYQATQSSSMQTLYNGSNPANTTSPSSGGGTGNNGNQTNSGQ